MRLTRQAALAIALVCGLLAAILAWVWIGQQGKPKVEVPTTVEIPVPIATIPPQTDLQPAMFRKVQIDRDKVPLNVITDEQLLVGRISLVDLAEGQPVGVSQVAVRSGRLGMAYSLDDGLRGMAVSLDVIGAVGDFIKPGNRVDVLSSFQQDGHWVVRTLVQDVVVLALGTTTTVAPPPSEEGAEAKTEEAAPRRQETPVTLALTPTQSQIILTADEAGDLRLTLRAMGDRGIVPLPVANSWSLIGPTPQKDGDRGGAASGTAPQPPTPQPLPTRPPELAGGTPTTAPCPPAGPRRPSVEVIRGNEREIVVPE